MTSRVSTYGNDNFYDLPHRINYPRHRSNIATGSVRIGFPTNLSIARSLNELNGRDVIQEKVELRRYMSEDVMAAPCAALRLQSSVASVSTHRTEELSTNVKFTNCRTAAQRAAFKVLSTIISKNYLRISAKM